MTKPIIVLIVYYPLAVKSCTHYLRPKGHTYELIGVIRSHLYPAASFGKCHLYLCFVFYFHCHISTVHVRLLRVY